MPPKVGIGNVHEDTLLPESVAEIVALDLKLVEAVFDRGFTTKATLATMAGLGTRVSSPAARKTTVHDELADVWPPIASAARVGSPTSSASTAPDAPG